MSPFGRCIRPHPLFNPHNGSRHCTSAMTPTRNLLCRLLVPALLWIFSAVTAKALNYDFENIPSIGATSVTIGAQTWTLTGFMIGEPRHELGAPPVGAA